MQKSKMVLSGEALQIAVKRREAKSKGEKERYKHLNTQKQKCRALEIACSSAYLARSQGNEMSSKLSKG